MRMMLVAALILLCSSHAYADKTPQAPEVTQVLAWIKETTTAPDSADARTSATLRHEVYVRRPPDRGYSRRYVGRRVAGLRTVESPTGRTSESARAIVENRQSFQREGPGLEEISHC